MSTAMSTLSVRDRARVLNNTSIFRSWQAVKTQRPITSDQEHRVLKFRPRTLAHPPGRREYPGDQALKEDAPPKPNDLSRYQQDRDEPDDFQHQLRPDLETFGHQSPGQHRRRDCRPTDSPT